MSGFSGRLPRLSGLLVFESAARNSSFTISAQELRVTQSAVSQQIRALEHDLGVTLFIRAQRGLAMTDEGRRLYRAVTMGFECVADAVREIRPARATTIRVGATFAIATYWLVPRLADFRIRHPEIDVHIVAADHGFDSVSATVDIGITFGRGNWPGFRSLLLREGDAFPVCSPAYLGGRPAPSDAEQLLDETLLVLEDTRATLLNWPLWFASQGIRCGEHRRIGFNSLPLLLQAACEGQGIALGWSLLTDDLLSRGVLIRPIGGMLRTAGAYYLVIAENTRQREGIEVFRGWLLSQFPLARAEPSSLPSPRSATGGTGMKPRMQPILGAGTR